MAQNNYEDTIKVLKSFIECLSIDCDDDCEHCHIQLDGITAVVEACAVAVTELSQIDTDTVSRPPWISVSERLPEEAGTYLCSIKCPKGEWVEMDYWNGEDWFINDMYNEMSTPYVVGWMPLPETYKEA